jgi:hypothetical protein
MTGAEGSGACGLRNEKNQTRKRGCEEAKHKAGTSDYKVYLNLGIIQDVEFSAWDLQKDGVDHGRKS